MLCKMTSKNQLTLPKEVLRVLAYPKLQLSEDEIRYLLDEEIRPWFHRITEEIPSDSWIPNDPGDDHFVNATRERLPVTVLTARELLDQLNMTDA